MIVQINGLRESVPNRLTIQHLIEWAKETDPHLIVELNGKYIYPTDYDKQPVSENDVIEFINPNLGG